MSLGVSPTLAADLATALESHNVMPCQASRMALPPPPKSEPSEASAAEATAPATNPSSGKGEPPKKKPKAPKPKASLFQTAV